MQTTIRTAINLVGTGLHTGRPVRMRILPAAAEFGIWFRRIDITDRDPLIAARFDNVRDTRLCTLIGNDAGVTVSTVEHLMAAFAGCGVHNALVELDGPEVPIMDGSSLRFVREILAAGVQRLNAPVRALRILRPVRHENGPVSTLLEPSDRFEIGFAIEFPDAAIGRQEMRLDMANGAFVRELATARTFCRRADVEDMLARGLGRGGNLDNAVVVDGARVLTPGGLRHADEPVRHKMLDALGDLALAGLPILGRYHGIRAGHAATNALLRKLFADPTAHAIVECDAETAARLPGVGVTAADVARVA